MTSADGDTGAGIIEDHPYVQRGADWWSVCRVCGLAEAAHKQTTHDPVATEGRSIVENEAIQGEFRG